MHGDRLYAGITMKISPYYLKHRTDQNVWHPAEPHHADTNGDGDGKFLDAEVRTTERRRRPPSSSPEGCLYALPALILLDRLPIPMLATGLDGVVVYTNLAFATMLGHPDTITLTGQRLPALLAGHSATPPRNCVTALRAAPTMVVDWLHAEGFPVRSVISNMVFVRATDQVLLISVTDITELTWTTTPAEPR
jgi:PAS domain-containing protein